MSRLSASKWGFRPFTSDAFVCLWESWGVVYLCYIDESGVSQMPGNSTHFVLAGIVVPIWHWKDCERQIQLIKQHYSLWRMPRSTQLGFCEIIGNSERYRILLCWTTPKGASRQPDLETPHCCASKTQGSSKSYKQAKKNFKQTEAYVHLTRTERRSFVRAVARRVGGWGYARLFAECLDKLHFDPSKHPYAVDGVAFE